MSYRVVLVKLLPSQFASDFLDGNLYLNTNAYFGKLDSTDTVRFDPHDGVDESRQVSKVEIKDESGNWLRLPVVGPVTLRSKLSGKLNILCLYAMTDREGDFFDSRNLAFGDQAVVITNLLEFIRRIKAAAKVAGKKVQHGPIQYVEREIHDGPMGSFRKYREQTYQNEFRFVFTDGDGSVCRLSIGDIRDIAYAMSSSNVAKVWQSMLSNSSKLL